MIRAGAIGAGMVFEHYRRAAEDVPEIAIVAVYDRDPSKPRTHSDLDSFLDEPLDAVLVLAPNAAHRALVEACLDRGLPTLCEKPLATTADDARALLERAGTLLYPAMHARHRPEVRWLAEHLDEPIAELSQTWLEDWSDGPAWYFRAEESGGGVLLDVGVNHIDWIARHLPALDVVDAEVMAWMGDVESECAVTWRFDGGTGRSHFSWQGSPERRMTQIRTASGTRITLDHDAKSATRDGRTYGPWRNDEYAGVLKDFARCRAGFSPPPGGVVEVLSLIARAREHLSVAQERRIS